MQMRQVSSAKSAVPTSSLATANGDAGASAGGAATQGRGEKAYRVQLTPTEKKRVEELIRNAKSLAEISRLEKELKEGRVPGA